jgi:hypothetical protein
VSFSSDSDEAESGSRLMVDAQHLVLVAVKRDWLAGRLMHLQSVESESTFAYFDATRAYLEAWQSLRHSAFAQIEFATDSPHFSGSV